MNPANDAIDTSDTDLAAVRLRINELDRALLETLSKRREAIVKVGEIKKIQGKEAPDPKRWQEVVDTRLAWAREAGIEDSVVKEIFEAIHLWSMNIQDEVKNGAENSVKNEHNNA